MIQEVHTCSFSVFCPICIENMSYLSGPKLCVEGSHDSLFSQSTGSHSPRLSPVTPPVLSSGWPLSEEDAGEQSSPIG